MRTRKCQYAIGERGMEERRKGTLTCFASYGWSESLDDLVTRCLGIEDGHLK
jgi:hypothetical protein